MKTTMLCALGIAACAFLLAIPMTAAARPPDKHQKATATATTKRKAWPAESLSGTIMTTDPAKHLLVVQSPQGVPFDMVVTPATRIRRGNQTLRLQDLMGQTYKAVSVRFIPERAGDVAQSIQVTG